MGKWTTETPKKKNASDYDGTTPLPPDEERACTAIARILVNVQARRAAAKAAQPPSSAEVTDD